MAAWKLGPALAAGCAILLKPAEQTPLAALYLGELALEAGLPAGVLNILPGFGETAGAAIAAHPGVAKVAFTGYVAGVAREGAQTTVGGKRGEGPGYYYEPTVVVNTAPDHRIMREEVFGPVVAAVPFKSVEEVVAAANHTTYGLAAGVWTRDLQKAHRVAHALKAGTVWINTYHVYDNALPFGGYKQSGWGRELGKDALEHYTETKSVVAAL